MGARLWQVSVASAALALVGAATAHADVVVDDIGGGVQPALNGKCSFDEAIAAASTPGTPSADCPGTVASGTTTIRFGTDEYISHGPAATAGANILVTGAAGAAARLTCIGSRALSVNAGATVALQDATIARCKSLDGLNQNAAAPGANGSTGNGGGLGGTGAAGTAGGDGGALLNAGTLSLTRMTLDANHAGAGGRGGFGGAGGRGGDRATGDSFVPSGGTGGTGGPGGAAGNGGAIFSSGTLNVTDSTFTANVAGDGGLGGLGGQGGTGGSPGGTTFGGGSGGSGGQGGAATSTGGDGGAIFSTGTLTITRTTFSQNAGGAGGFPGGGGRGGTGWGPPAGDTSMSFAGNGGLGGAPGVGGGFRGGDGGTLATTGSAQLTDVAIRSSNAGPGGRSGSGGDGGSAGTVFFAARGAAGGGGAAAATSAAAGGNGGGIYAGGGTTTVDRSEISASQAGLGGRGGNGGSGGSGQFTGGSGGNAGGGGPGGKGGAITVEAATVTITNSTLTGDTAGLGGSGGVAGFGVFQPGGNGGGGGGGGTGGALHTSGTTSNQVRLVSSTVAGNAAGGGVNGSQGGNGSTVGTAGSRGADGTVGGVVSSGVGAASTIIANNTPANCQGTVVDNLRNLRFGDTTCPGVTGDPQLGPLQDNGGATRTRGLGSGSAAIDADAACAATDQRGIARPQGGSCDIGAFERGAAPVCVDVVVRTAFDTDALVAPGCTSATGAPTTAVADTNPAHGTVNVTADPHVLRYDPEATFKGTDTFTYHATTGDGVSETRTVTLIVAAPPPPVLTGLLPASPSMSSEPRVTGTAPAGATVALFVTADCSGAPAATDTAAQLASPGLTLTVPLDATTIIHATATGASGVASDCADASIAYTQDQTAPDTVLDSGPSGQISEPKPSFAFHATETAGAFECSIDQGTPAFAPCPAAGYTPALPLALGAYTFRVRATDLVGLVDATPATRSFTVVAAPATVTPPPPPPPPSVTGPAKPGPTTTSKPRLLGELRSCTSRRRLTVHLSALKTKPTSVTIRIRGKVVKVVSGKRVTATVSLKGLPAGSFTLRIDVKGPRGFTYRETRSYKTCVRPRKR